MSLTVVGDFERGKLIKIAEKICNKYCVSRAENIAPNNSVEVKEYKPFYLDISKKNHQANCIIGTQAYSIRDPRRIALILLVNILGGPSSNSKLNSTLRERKALVYNIEANYTQYSTIGLVTIYFGCDKSNIDKCIALVKDELAKCTEAPLSASALKIAKKQMLAQLAISAENGEVQALSIGKSILSFDRYLSDEQVRAKVEAVTSEDILNVAKDIFEPSRLSTLIYR
jgi:predicted Zn-dependent peptidase